MPIELPNTCPRGLTGCQPLANIVSDGDDPSFVCVGANSDIDRSIPSDVLRRCVRSSAGVDSQENCNRRDLVDEVSVVAQALSVIENTTVAQAASEHLNPVADARQETDDGSPSLIVPEAAKYIARLVPGDMAEVTVRGLVKHVAPDEFQIGDTPVDRLTDVVKVERLKKRWSEHRPLPGWWEWEEGGKGSYSAVRSNADGIILIRVTSTSVDCWDRAAATAKEVRDVVRIVRGVAGLDSGEDGGWTYKIHDKGPS